MNLTDRDYKEIAKKVVGILMNEDRSVVNKKPLPIGQVTIKTNEDELLASVIRANRP